MNYDEIIATLSGFEHALTEAAMKVAGAHGRGFDDSHDRRLAALRDKVTEDRRWFERQRECSL
jgi:hypothetical protein